MKKSESIKSISEAIAKAQGEIENASKNSVNPHFKSRYADLAEVLNTVRPVFSRHGLAVTQDIETVSAWVSVTTMISHESGEWIEGTISAPLLQQTPQGVGSVATYLRRYSLAAMCGVAQEDDDGNAASHAKPAPAQVVEFSAAEKLALENESLGIESAAQLDAFAAKLKTMSLSGSRHEFAVGLYAAAKARLT